MNKFAFIVHPLDIRRDIAKKFPIARYMPESLVSAAMRHVPPMVVAHLTGIRSITGVETEGWFIACPLSPQQLLTLPVDEVYGRLIQCGNLAQSLGAGIVGLGALTSVVGDGGITIQRTLDIAVTTGNSYTVATAVEGARRGVELMGMSLSKAHVAIVGAAGSIGRTCATLLEREAARLTLIGRNVNKLMPVAQALQHQGHAEVTVTDNIDQGLQSADVVVTVTSAVDAVIHPQHLKRGAVVCDVARPRDVSVRVAQERNDVLIMEGGVVAVPGEMRICKTNGNGTVDKPQPFSFGFPPGTAYACMSETMMLALDNRFEPFTLGKEVSVAQAEEAARMACKHGFRLAGFRSFERAVTDEDIARVQQAVRRR